MYLLAIRHRYDNWLWVSLIYLLVCFFNVFFSFIWWIYAKIMSDYLFSIAKNTLMFQIIVNYWQQKKRLLINWNADGKYINADKIIVIVQSSHCFANVAINNHTRSCQVSLTFFPFFDFFRFFLFFLQLRDCLSLADFWRQNTNALFFFAVAVTNER